MAAAVEMQGDADAMCEALASSKLRFSQDLSRLKMSGVARTVSLYDPRRIGCAYETLVQIKLRDYAPAAIARFEALLLADKTVTMAVMVSGSHDYEVRAFHPDHREARIWSRALEAEQAVLWVRTIALQSLWGDNLAGMRLERLKE